MRVLSLAVVAALGVATPSGIAQPVGPLTWGFDEMTSGGDVHFVSPTAINPGASVFNVTLQLSKIEVDLQFLGLQIGPIDVTSLLPPPFLLTQVEAFGPAPISTSQTINITNPELTGTFSTGLNAAGFATMDITNVSLGLFTIDLGPPLGLVTANLTGIRVQGSVTMHATWFDLGSGLAGAAGTPQMVGGGSLEPGTPVSLSITQARPNAPSFLVYSIFPLNAPFRGGTLVPQPDFLFFFLTDPTGSVLASDVIPADVPGGVTVYVQAWMLDPTGPRGFSASNALRLHTP